jgi:hypothetical protein
MLSVSHLYELLNASPFFMELVYYKDYYININNLRQTSGVQVIRLDGTMIILKLILQNLGRELNSV